MKKLSTKLLATMVFAAASGAASLAFAQTSGAASQNKLNMQPQPGSSQQMDGTQSGEKSKPVRTTGATSHSKSVKSMGATKKRSMTKHPLAPPSPGAQ